ncbi:MAG: hypothetical protein JNL58_18825 [Planctomyces sp.]|nr:hypothetical protein [Planctomyces sp.]
MLSRRILLATFVTAITMGSYSRPTAAQFYNNGCSSCGTPAVAAAPMANCTPIQPVYSTCYQTVPVTTYTREKQTVEVPYYETAYEEREVTVYRPVTRQREVEVPTVAYQNVTEYRTVNRDLGRWVTQYHPISRCTPCQVDPRPGVIGWLNRTGYSFQTAFMPSYTTSRQYVPNMVTCNVPQVRQVAIHGTRKVTVAETEMVAERKMEKVAVQKLAYRKEDVTVMRPQTAYRTVPIGTSVAYAPGFGATAFAPYYGGVATAYGYPIIDNTRSRSASADPTPDPIGGGARSADAEPFPSDGNPRTGSSNFRRNEPSGTDATGTGLERTFPADTPQLNPAPAADIPPFGSGVRRSTETLAKPPIYESSPARTGLKTASSSGWKAANRSTAERLANLNDKPATKVSLAETKAAN